jgi:UPF0271 protein
MAGSAGGGAAPRTIDLNADLGESFGRWTLGDDAAMVGLVTSANVACGFHAGDPLTLLRTVELAVAAGVRVGAQVSYRDLAGFGRRFVDASVDELRADVIYQLGALDGVCRAAGTRVTYVKPHGALYNTVVHHGAHAEAVVGAVLAYGPELGILGLPNSELLRQATAAGIRCHAEAYADRAYNADGTLVSRRDPGALLDDPAVVAERVVRMVTQGRLTAVDGTELEIEPDSVCIHGDSPGAVAMARQVRAALAGAGVGIEAFT